MLEQPGSFQNLILESLALRNIKTIQFGTKEGTDQWHWEGSRSRCFKSVEESKIV